MMLRRTIRDVRHMPSFRGLEQQYLTKTAVRHSSVIVSESSTMATRRPILYSSAPALLVRARVDKLQLVQLDLPAKTCPWAIRYLSDKKDVISDDKKSEPPPPAADRPFNLKQDLDRRLENASPLVAQMERRIKRVVDDLNIADHLSVITIVLLLCGILLGPYLTTKMKESDSTYDIMASDDPVDDFTKLVRQGWGVQDDENSQNQNPLETLLQDVLQSKALQEATQQFVVQLLHAPAVQQALGRLAKSLWSDLVSDPETVAQVVKLLQIAIQNPEIKRAAQQLVIDLVDEPEVKQSLLVLIERLGQEDQVRLATQALLTDAAHHSLNDPELLEHSMDFASDIVGDDVVQKTARDALWNTLGQTLRPVTTIFLTATGVGLLLLGILSIGYARSNDDEAKLFESVARSMQTNAWTGLSRIVSWPQQQVAALWESLVTAILVPVLWVHSLLRHGGQASYGAVQRAGRQLVRVPSNLLHTTWMYLSTGAHNFASRTRYHVMNASHTVADVVVSGTVAFVHRATLTLSNVTTRTSKALRSSARFSSKALHKLGDAGLDALARWEWRIRDWIAERVYFRKN